jgi:hypothetical protein
MRVADRPLPTVAAHADPNGRPIRPVIALEPKQATALAWGDPSLAWDDPRYVWDQPVTTVWSDAFCDWFGLTVDQGNPDDKGLFDAPHAIVQIDNRSGAWSQYNADGTLVNYGPGRHLAIWATDGAGGAWWLFYGRIARYDERADDTIEVEAFGLFSDLAQPIGTYTPGVNGQKPEVRQTAIVGAAGFTDRTRFDPGIVALTAQVTDRAPLEEMQIVATSDGGVLYEDSDGTIVATARAWRSGRTDQTSVPVVSDNVCQAPVIVWDAELSTTDDGLADVVILENVGGLRATATNPTPLGRYVWTDTDQQWTGQGEGDALAAFRVTNQRAARVRLQRFALYLFDPHQVTLWGAVDWRIGDRIRFIHDAQTVTGLARLDVTAIVSSIHHDVTPEGWIMELGTTRAIDWFTPAYWDTAGQVWNDSVSVWGY